MVFLVLNLGYDFYNILKASFFTGNSITFFFFFGKGVSETLPWQAVVPLKICFILQVEGGFNF